MVLQVGKIRPAEQAAEPVDVEIDIGVPGRIECSQQITAYRAALGAAQPVSLTDLGQEVFETT